MEAYPCNPHIILDLVEHSYSFEYLFIYNNKFIYF